MSKTTFSTSSGVRSVELAREGDRVVARVDGGAPRALEARVENGEVLLRDPASGAASRAIVRRDGDAVLVFFDGEAYRLAPEKAARRGGGAGHDAALEAPMPGTCRAVLVKAGDEVEKNARLVILEAMKMEHELRAPRAGTIKAVHVAAGDPVAPGKVLVELADA